MRRLPREKRSSPVGCLTVIVIALFALFVDVTLVAIVHDDPFVRGDVNQDGVVDVSDDVALRTFLFLPGGSNCWDQADVNADGSLDTTDVVVLARFLFLGGPPPAPPWPGCGQPPTYHWDCNTDYCLE